MKFHIKTYGCQMNERDSEAVGAMLINNGYERAESEDDADIIIVNTCSVRQKAEDKAIGKLGLLTADKKNKTRIVGMIGCMAQRLQNRVFDLVPGLDFAIGTQRLSKLPEILDSVLNSKGRVIETGIGHEMDSMLTGHESGRVTAFINILFGCDRGCAYCVVPAVRGEERSRPAFEIIDEVRKLAETGTKDVTLLGQSVMSYGRKNNVWSSDDVSRMGLHEPFPRLLEAVSNVEGMERVRFTSGHPSGCTEELVRCMAELPRVCEHLHLPLQSGSDRILKLMRRGYDTDQYRNVVGSLKCAVPGMAVTTDIIVGFPSETNEEFEMTRRFMQEIEFDNSFIFKYSSRPDTPAAAWVDDVSEEEKMRRNQVLLEEQDERLMIINEKLIGKHFETLIEGPSKRNPAFWSGRTRTNKIVVFEKRDGIMSGDMRNVIVERVTAQTLYGRLL